MVHTFNTLTQFVVFIGKEIKIVFVDNASKVWPWAPSNFRDGPGKGYNYNL